ncbi:MAG TPA: site-specific integrase [Verrucomicrobiae bacterium]|nr:site-specific integrase [Verrucomicrobiae bacterium]
MASIHRQPGKPFWYCAHSAWNPDLGKCGKWVRRFRSTKTTNKKQALEICRTWEKAAKLGHSGELTPDRAREVVADGVRDIFLTSNRDKLKTYTVREWGKQWLDGKSIDTAPRTHERYSSIMTRFYGFLGAKADRSIAGIAATDILTFRDNLAKELSINTANLAVKTLRVCFGDAHSNDLLTSNTAAKVKKLRFGGRAGQRRDFNASEIRLLLQAAGNSEWRGLILTGLYTGQRLGDLAQLQWNQVNLDTKEIVFHVSKTKRELPLPLARPLVDYFEGLQSSDDPAAFVFPKAAAVSLTGTLSNQFYRLMEQAGLAVPRENISTGRGHGVGRKTSPLSFHSLRHSNVTFLKAAGASDAIAQAIAGHSSSAVSKIYTHLDTDTLRRAIDKLPDVTKTPMVAE